MVGDRGGGDRHVHDRLDAAPRARPLRPAARGAPARRWRPARPARWWRWRSSPSSARGSRPWSSCSRCSRTPTTPRAPAPARCSASPRAVAIGALIYRGGIKLNLARFFRITGLVLVLVAAGLVASAIHTAHEAGWLNAGQAQAFDLSWLVVPGTWTSALLTGMLGWQPQPTEAEVIGYFALPRPRHAVRAVAARSSARAWRAPPSTTTLLLLLVLALAACGVERRRQGRRGSKQVEVKLTDAGCSPATLKLDAGRTDLQGHERRHRPRERARGAEGLAHPRREGEPRRRPLRLVHDHAAAGPVHAELPRRHDAPRPAW